MDLREKCDEEDQAHRYQLSEQRQLTIGTKDQIVSLNARIEQRIGNAHVHERADRAETFTVERVFSECVAVVANEK